MQSAKNKFGRRAMVWTILVAAGLFFSGANDVWAMAAIGDLSLDVQVYAGSSSHGYAEYRVSVTNHSTKKDHEVTLVIPDRANGSGNQIVRMSRSVIVGANSTSVVSMFQPSLPIIGSNRMAVIIDGVQSDDEVLIPMIQPNMIYRWAHLSSVCLLVSRGVGSQFNDAAEKKYEELTAAASSRPSMGMRTYAGSSSDYVRPYSNRAESPVAEWSDNWLAYTRYTMVIMTGEEFERMPADVRGGIFGYLRAGGTVLVEGRPELPKDIAAGEVIVGAPESKMKKYSVGFGQVIVSQEPDVAKWSETQWTEVFDLWKQIESPWFNLNNAFAPVEESEQFRENWLPVRGMFGLMILFAVVIGPVNLFVLSWKRKRTWLLWTTPLFSLVTCLAVLGYNLSAEGWHGRVYLDGLTLLDEANHQATSIGWGRYYCPLTPGGGLRFDAQTEVTPIYDSRDLWDTMRMGSPKTLDWTNGQHLASGWIAARSPTYYLFRSDRPRRERLIVRKSDDGKIIVSNSLGATIKKLTLIDAKGISYSAGDIKAGAEKVLISGGTIPESMQKSRIDLPGLFQERLNRSETIAANPEHYLRSGMYVAVLEGSPFMEAGLGGKIELKGESVVYGIMKGAE
jgi:hypothetical protein